MPGTEEVLGVLAVLCSVDDLGGSDGHRLLWKLKEMCWGFLGCVQGALRDPQAAAPFSMQVYKWPDHPTEPSTLGKAFSCLGSTIPNDTSGLPVT